MRKQTKNICLIFIVFASVIHSQNSEIKRLVDDELKMTFPSIYFKHNSTEYASMPYTADSCFKYITAHVKEINSRPIWQDSSETEQLTTKRIKKIINDLKVYSPSSKTTIQSMKKAQKISQKRIYSGTDSIQIQYLLSLNSVLDMSGVIHKKETREKNHIERPRLSCWDCWKNGFHLQRRRKFRKMKKHYQEKQEAAVNNKM